MSKRLNGSRRWVAALVCLFVLLSAAAYARVAPAEYQMPYYIFVDLTNQIVTVYRTEDDSIARQMLCSTGLKDYTPIGNFLMKDGNRSCERTGNWYEFYEFGTYAKWASRITGPILFHTLTYDYKKESGVNKTAIRKFGMPASHGCVRLLEEDAKFIAQKCLQGTLVRIYQSKEFDNELRLMLREGSYTGENGMTYNQFMGIASSEDEYGLHSEGGAVSDLQARLKELGYYTGDTDGVYDAEMLIAVKKFQKKVGNTATGIVTPELKTIIFSEDAPISEELTMQEGSAGAVVTMLQDSLTRLGLYSGSRNGIYDAEVAQAVRDFQGANDYEQDGVASPEIQAAVKYHLNELEKEFGSTDGLNAEINREEIQMGTINTPVRVIVRKKASQKSDDVGRVESGATVITGETDGKWIQVWDGKTSGYVKKAYVDLSTQYNLTVDYSRNGSDKKYRMGHTMDEYAKGAKSFSSFFSDYFISQEFQQNVETETHFAIVNTGDDTLELNLRMDADAESEILTTIPNGESVQALDVGSEWTYAMYQGQNGYLMNQYLDLGDLAVSEEEDSEDEGDRTPIYAVVVAPKGKAPVFDSDSADAQVLGSLKNKTVVQVVRASESDSWVLISLEGRQGYMLDDNLKFQMTGE